MLPSFVNIVEVGPRDGLQNEKQFIPTETKIELINQLSQTGLQTIEAVSFVSPKKIPQMQDSELVIQQIHPYPNVNYTALVPNLEGLEKAIKYGVKEIAVFTTVSETFSRKNTNCTVDESFERCKAVIQLAKKHHIKVRGYISCVIACPYEGKISPTAVAQLAKKLLHEGCYQISLGDTIGIGTPGDVKKLLRQVIKSIPPECLAVHFHDTYGQALVNIYEALHWGIHTIDSSIAGLGGCPYAKGASGNVATEDVVYMLNGLHIKTGVNLDKLSEVSLFISDKLHRAPYSKVTVAYRKK
jgi:hydroxymethylglutaryl-CoA lyase